MRHAIRWENQKGSGAKNAGGWYQCALLFAGSTLGLCAAYMQLLDTYALIRSLAVPKGYVLAVLLAAAALAALYGSGILRSFWLRLLPAVPLGLCFYRYYKTHQLPLEDGGLYIARCYVRRFCIFFKKSILFPNGLREEAPGALLFWSLLLLCVCFVLAGAFRARVVLLLPSVLLLAAHIAVGSSPGWGSAAVLLAAGVVLAGRWDALPDRWHVRTAQLAGVLCVCIIIGLFGASLPQRVVGMHEKVQKKQWAMEDAVLALPVWRAFEQPGVVDNGKPRYSGREVLSVWCSDEPTENIYLKDYAASRYENGRWVQEPEAFGEAAGKEGLDVSTAGRAILSKAYESRDTVFDNKIDFLDYGGWSIARPKQHGYEITCTDFGTNAPLPYVGSVPKELSVEGDTAAKRPWNLRSYSGGLMLGGRQADPLLEYLEMYYGATSWIWVGGVASAVSSGFAASGETRADWYGAMAEERYTPQSDDALLEMVMTRWLEGFRFSDMRSHFEAIEAGGQAGTVNYARLMYARSVQYCLQNFGEYSQNLDALPAGEDPIDYFLGTSERGYCVHYASAAVRILQSMGIPARYASGYVAFHSDFRKAKGADGYTASVKDERAHAWAEIYLEDFGWFPIEVTPGFSGGVAPKQEEAEKSDAGGENGKNGDAKEERPDVPGEQEKEEPETPEQKQPAANGAKQKAAGMSRELRFALGCLAALAGVALLAAAALAAARERARRREEQIVRALAAGHYRDAANRMNRRIYRMLRRRVTGIGVKDDDAYRDALAGLSAEGDADTYMRIVKEARFSDRELTKEDADALYGQYRIYREALRHGKTRPAESADV